MVLVRTRVRLYLRDAALYVLVVTHELRHPQGTSFIDCSRDVSMDVPCFCQLINSRPSAISLIVPVEVSTAVWLGIELAEDLIL
jgi:hypothetical protein